MTHANTTGEMRAEGQSVLMPQSARITRGDKRLTLAANQGEECPSTALRYDQSPRNSMEPSLRGR